MFGTRPVDVPNGPSVLGRRVGVAVDDRLKYHFHPPGSVVEKLAKLVDAKEYGYLLDILTLPPS